MSPHYPEDFLVFLADQTIREAAVDRERFHSNGREFLILPWSAEQHSEWVTMPYYVRLCVENVLVHAWTQDTAARIVGRRA